MPLRLGPSLLETQYQAPPRNTGTYTSTDSKQQTQADNCYREIQGCLAELRLWHLGISTATGRSA
ncbi:hypothetical protein CRENBAI_010194 [Crenichthys baileyi]|uniref:Uncharacterized protein n=1 Tax=Crenichthys baileyi TaxID=28760 RepID=A0AAV9RB05_9TELE